MNKIWAIILAAGESKRMGSPKMLLDFGGKTMLERVIDNVIASEITNIVVVLGAEKDKLKMIADSYPVNICFNENYAEGMLSSVLCGIRSLPDNYEAVLIFQGDQPFVAPLVISFVLAAYKSTGKGIVIPTAGGKRGHPLLIDRKYKPEIDKIDSNQGLRSLACRYSDDVMEVETFNPGILKDFDTTADYNEINKHLKYERKD
jgi:molybdenum cofactor cytidylyltransferase